MSRVGEMPITVPDGEQITQDGSIMTVNGPKGTLSRDLHRAIAVKVDDGKIVCERPSNSKPHRSLHGLVRTLVNNMIVGVTKGYEKKLNVIGVGFRAELQGETLNLQVGHSRPEVVEPYEGVQFEVGQDTNTRMPFIILRGIDKELVGRQAAEIRAVRPPSPYKKPTEKMSKGIRYDGEYVRQKAGKAAKAAL